MDKFEKSARIFAVNSSEGDYDNALYFVLNSPLSQRHLPNSLLAIKDHHISGSVTVEMIREFLRELFHYEGGLQGNQVNHV